MDSAKLTRLNNLIRALGEEIIKENPDLVKMAWLIGKAEILTSEIEENTD